jgi:hypothetical protein
MWHDIVRANAPAVANLLRHQIGELQSVLAAIEGSDWTRLYELFERARMARERHLTKIE